MARKRRIIRWDKVALLQVDDLIRARRDRQIRNRRQVEKRLQSQEEIVQAIKDYDERTQNLLFQTASGYAGYAIKRTNDDPSGDYALIGNDFNVYKASDLERAWTQPIGWAVVFSAIRKD